MVTIVFDHPAEDFPELKIAGEFTNWEGVPMKINTSSGKWEYKFDESSVTKHNDKDKVHFKFIDRTVTGLPMMSIQRRWTSTAMKTMLLL